MQSKVTHIFVDFTTQLEWCVLSTKGQLISECLLDVLNFPKKQCKNLINFCPSI